MWAVRVLAPFGLSKAPPCATFPDSARGRVEGAIGRGVGLGGALARLSTMLSPYSQMGTCRSCDRVKAACFSAELGNRHSGSRVFLCPSHDMHFTLYCASMPGLLCSGSELGFYSPMPYNLRFWAAPVIQHETSLKDSSVLAEAAPPNIWQLHCLAP